MSARSCTRPEVEAALARRPIALADRGLSLAARFAELGARPHPDKCDHLLRDLHEARTVIAHLRDELLRTRTHSR